MLGTLNLHLFSFPVSNILYHILTVYRQLTVESFKLQEFITTVFLPHALTITHVCEWLSLSFLNILLCW